MTYTARNSPALGDAWDTIKSASAAIDPYLPETFCRIDELRALHKDRTALQAFFGKPPTVPVPNCVRTLPGQHGIGVEKALKPLRAAAYVYRHPVAVWAGLTAILTIPFVAGYFVGRGQR